MLVLITFINTNWGRKPRKHGCMMMSVWPMKESSTCHISCFDSLLVLRAMSGLKCLHYSVIILKLCYENCVVFYDTVMRCETIFKELGTDEGLLAKALPVSGVI